MHSGGGGVGGDDGGHYEEHKANDTHQLEDHQKSFNVKIGTHLFTFVFRVYLLGISIRYIY